VRKYGLPVLIVVLFFGHCLRIPIDLVSFKTTAIVPNDLALIAFTLLLLLRKLRLRQLFVRNAYLAAPVALFILAAGVSLLVNAGYYNLHDYEVYVSSLFLMRWILYCAAYFIVVDLVRSREEAAEMVGVLSVALVAFAIFGIYQAIFLPDFAFIVHPEATEYDWDPQHNRLVSTFLDPNLAGCLIGVGLAFSVAFLMEGYRKAWLAVCVFGAALLLTYSRGGTLSFSVGFLYLVATGKRKHRAVIALATVALIAMACAPYLLEHAALYNRLTIEDVSAQSRINNWMISDVLIRSNFFFGIGFDTLPYVIHRFGYGTVGSASFGLDGGLLLIFVLTGIFGFLAYCFLLGKVLWMSHGVAKRTKDRFFFVLAKGTFAATIIILVSSLFTSSLTFSFTMEFSWMMFALLGVAYRYTEPGPVDASVPVERVRARHEWAGRGVSAPVRVQ